jgi:hypothetical protein
MLENKFEAIALMKIGVTLSAKEQKKLMVLTRG